MKVKREVDYYKEICEVKIVCDNMIVNSDYEYELKSDCVKCRRESICRKYIYRLNIRTDLRLKIKKVISDDDKYKDILKLNCEYVYLGKKRSKSKNKELIRRIEDMKRNGEEIKVLRM